MFSLKVLFVLMVLCLASVLTESFDTKRPQHSVVGKDRANVRKKRFLFNLFNTFPGNFNSFPRPPRPDIPLTEDESVQILQRQRRILERASAGNNAFGNDDFYVQGLLQQRRVRQRYFEQTGERLYSDRGYYDNDDYNNNRFRNY